MRIEVVRSGGLLGAPRRAALDTEGHPDAAQLDALAASALAEAGASSVAPDPAGRRAAGADRFSYGVTLDGRRIDVAESALTEPMRELVRRVLAAG